jgi:hypothetical protein
MESVDRLLVKEADQLILLLTPPFDKTAHDHGNSILGSTIPLVEDGQPHEVRVVMG